jgi:hypothetical protein
VCRRDRATFAGIDRAAKQTGDRAPRLTTGDTAIAVLPGKAAPACPGRTYFGQVGVGFAAQHEIGWQVVAVASWQANKTLFQFAQHLHDEGYT